MSKGEKTWGETSRVRQDRGVMSRGEKTDGEMSRGRKERQRNV